MNILVAIANYGDKNMAFLNTIIREYQSMPYHVDIVVMSNIPKTLGPGVEVKVGLPTKDPWSLPFGHKKLFAERSKEYDLFIYSEDDTLIRENNIRAFMDVTHILPEQEIAGFVRYEVDTSGNKYYSTVHSHFHWVPDSAKAIGGYTFARFTNDHSACYLLTQKQLKKAIDSGGFLVAPHSERYDLLVTAATDPYTQCGFSKVICISRLQDFEIHHMPDVYIGKLGLSDSEFQRQIEALLKHAADAGHEGTLFPTATRLKQERWSKSYYEKNRGDITALIPRHAVEVLSVGCGWGATEEALVHKGHKVVAIPLDAIIGASAQAKGVEVTCPDFERAYDELSGRSFDCMVFSDVLQYLHDPVKILSRYADLLTEEGFMVISVPNFQHIMVRRQLASEGISSGDANAFDRLGIHLTSKGMLQKWMKQSNLKVDRLIPGFRGRGEKLAPVTPGILRKLIASHYIVVARRS